MGAIKGAEEVKSHKFFTGIDWEKLKNKGIPPPVISKRPAFEIPELINQPSSADIHEVRKGDTYEDFSYVLLSPERKKMMHSPVKLSPVIKLSPSPINPSS